MNNWNPFMNNLRPLLLACATACSLLTAHAQSLFQFPKGPAAWTVDIVPWSGGEPTPSTLPPGPSFEVKKIEVTSGTDGVTRSVVTFKDGKSVERWGFDRYRFMILTETYNGMPTFMSGEDNQLGAPFFVGFDAASFSWIKDELLKDNPTYLGKKCLHYQGVVNIQRTVWGGGGHKSLVIVPYHCEAWIEKDTLLPVAEYDGTKLGVFTFSDPPTVPLNPPERVKYALDHFIAAARPLK